jgi:hypothetical protein
MINVSNQDFYSDQVEITSTQDTYHTLLTTLARGKQVFLHNYLTQMKLHIAAIEKLVADNPTAKDIRMTLDPNTTLGTLKFVGTKPWEREKIDLFENAVKSEKEEIDQMRSLIEKYPGKAASALGWLVEQNKQPPTEATV